MIFLYSIKAGLRKKSSPLRKMLFSIISILHTEVYEKGFLFLA